jgi:carboxypeptidase C (cathepsin A)
MSLLAAGGGAWAQPATPGPATQERPSAASQNRREQPDEPLAQPGPVVERRSERGQRAQENRLSDLDIAVAPVREVARTSRHTVTIGGRTIPYTATAGTLTLRDDDGKPIASMFYVAYVADRAKGEGDRPITFFYNGGPGSSSMWLHMGSFGPRRVVTSAPNPTPAAPFAVVNNENSLLDKTDIVFLDAIGTGYSRPLGDTKGQAFWGVDEDIDGFTRGITRYVTLNHRWNSPKFLFGESYGTLRSAGLVYALEQQGMPFNGVILLSSILNYGVRDAGFDQIYVTYLPSYAVTAAYHGKIAKPADMQAFLQETRDWARGPYQAALAKGHNISPAELDAVAKQMSAYTGVSADYLKQVNLRLDLTRFRKELLRDRRRAVGRLDSRFTGTESDPAGDGPEYDPADAQSSGAYVSAVHDYLERELGYVTEMAYRPSGNGINQAWNWKHKPPGANRPANVANTAQDLGAAIRQNPHLMVYSLNGIYDMATPFFGAEYDLAHMWLEPELRGNVRFAYYPSGHMVYLHPDSHRQMKADVAKFYDDALRR